LKMNSTMSEQLAKPLNDLHQLARTLFLSLSPPATRPPPAPPIEAFLECDARIAEAVRLARVHQVKHQRIEELKREILDLESKLKQVFRELERGRLELEEVLDEAETRLKGIETAERGVSYDDLLNYASRLSAFTSAPPNMPDLAPGQPPPPLFFPPFPNEEKMRRGRLNEEAPLGQGILGEAHSVARPKTPSPIQTQPDPRQQMQYLLPHPPATQLTVQDFAFDLDLNPDL